MSAVDETRLRAMLAGDGRPAEERRLLVRLMALFADRPPPPDPFVLMPDYDRLRDAFLDAAGGDDGEALEEAFLALYCHVHGHEAPYTPEERRRVDETGGYWGHAGGLSPVLKAGAHVGPESTVGDFGAGNGLQGLLMQVLHPHRRTVQIEISSRMVEAGRRLQEWLGVPPERVDWIAGDVLDHSPRDMDLVYLYRPVRPVGAGDRFYRRFAAELPPRAVVFSVADCLRPYLGGEWEAFWSDGHLTCWRRRA